MPAGQISGMIKKIKDVGDVVEDIMGEAREVLERLKLFSGGRKDKILRRYNYD